VAGTGGGASTPAPTDAGAALTGAVAASSIDGSDLPPLGSTNSNSSSGSLVLATQPQQQQQDQVTPRAADAAVLHSGAAAAGRGTAEHKPHGIAEATEALSSDAAAHTDQHFHQTAAVYSRAPHSPCERPIGAEASSASFLTCGSGASDGNRSSSSSRRGSEPGSPAGAAGGEGSASGASGSAGASYATRDGGQVKAPGCSPLGTGRAVAWMQKLLRPQKRHCGF
jgi:hypothetical protein